MEPESKTYLTIGRESLEAFYNPSPEDGYEYTVEINAGNPNPGDTRFFPRKLSDVSSELFPDNSEIIFYAVPSSFRHIYDLAVRKKNGVCIISLTVSFDFANWDLPESLSSFVDRYRDALVDIGTFSSISPVRTDYGFDIVCTAIGNESDNLFETIESFESILEKIYRNSVIPNQNNNARAYGEERRHWWIRYVVVPILCSGSVAGVLAYYLFD